MRTRLFGCHFGRCLAYGFFLWGGIQSAYAGPTITCSSATNIFNSGFNGTTGVLASGTTDTYWEVSARQSATSPIPTTPPSGLTWYRAIVGNSVPGSWVASPFATAQWISREYGTSSTGDWYYRYQFNLDSAVDASQFALNMAFMADNSVAEIYVNGVAQSPNLSGALPQGAGSYLHGGFYSGAQASVSLSQNWQTGSNELIVLIHSGSPYEGFLAYVTGSPTCKAAVDTTSTSVIQPVAVPTLNQWMLAGLALILGALGWRKARRYGR